MLIPVMIDEHARESDDFAPLDDRQQKGGQAQTLLAFIGDSQRVIAADRGVTDATTLEIELRGRSRSEEHTSELQSLMRISYAVFCLNKTKTTTRQHRKKT